MSKFAALLKKDWYLSRKQLLIPVWVVGGYYLLIMIAGLIAYLKFGADIEWSDFSRLEFPTVGILSYFSSMVMMGLPGLLALLVTLVLTQSALNDDVKRNAELFHRSQPVSVWQRTLAKFSLSIGGNWAILILISAFNFLLMTVLLSIFAQFNFWPALAGMVQGLIVYFKITLVLGSILFLASAVFRDKAFVITLAILAGVHSLFIILNFAFGWHLPLPLNYLYELLKFSSITSLEGDISTVEVRELIRENWGVIVFNWKTLLQIIFSGIMYAAATLIYKNKEIK
ncbi:MAG: hypothetical protein JW784_06255 [Candidatus Cloacimonetes bacterium]|nr:hypothetical protein [Candidatus Cloacimonadota bacterium]